MGEAVSKRHEEFRVGRVVSGVATSNFDHALHVAEANEEWVPQAAQKPKRCLETAVGATERRGGEVLSGGNTAGYIYAISFGGKE